MSFSDGKYAIKGVTIRHGNVEIRRSSQSWILRNVQRTRSVSFTGEELADLERVVQDLKRSYEQ